MKDRVNNSQHSQLGNSFDYDVLEPDRRLVLKQRTEEIKERLKRSAQDIWEIGQKLFEVRSQLKHGQLDNWLKAEFGWSRRTAYNFIKVYEAFPERATVAQVNIAASALYQLSSPSTPKEVREKFIQKAQEGEKITRQNIRQAVKQEKISSPSNAVVVTKPIEISDLRQQIISVIPKGTKIKALSEEKSETQKSEDGASHTLMTSKLQSKGWYTLGKKHCLFYGDTASPQFYKILPHIDLAIAITASDWDHDWLIDMVDNLLVLKEPLDREDSISIFISLLSKPGDTVLFPWIPNENMIDLAHKSERIVVAGDSNRDRCQRAIDKSNLPVKPIRSR